MLAVVLAKALVIHSASRPEVMHVPSEGETLMQVTPLLKQKEVATWTGMSEAWLEQSRFKGLGIPYIKIGRAVRYRVDDVQHWIDAHYIAAGI